MARIRDEDPVWDLWNTNQQGEVFCSFFFNFYCRQMNPLLHLEL